MGELRIDKLSKTYARRESWNSTRYLKVFENVSFTVKNGEFVSVIGSSGCGKSTLLSIAGGLAPATSGTVTVDDRPISGPGLDRGIVFQEFALFPWLTVLGNIAFGLKAKGVPRAKREEIARKYVELVGLTGFEEYHPNRLSGGMRQRVGLARALAIEPAALLMDEPFGALDAQTREAMQNALADISAKTRNTILFITHDIREAIYLS
ncbi:MAG: ABC transporter ATP-binding protein, partial [Rhodobiaceae bacterium]|nr:ABC transporter ATP-binding protein [Rhodobiaceae bacterium]